MQEDRRNVRALLTAGAGRVLVAAVSLELGPEVRDWLESLNDGDYKRVDEVCGMLAEKGNQLGGPWSDHLDGAV